MTDERDLRRRAAEQVTRQLGFDCHDVSPVISVRNPFDLASWTMPVLELLIIAGAVFALVHAVRRFRGGDPINLALWFAPLVYLFVTEPPLYFPEWFGLDQQFGFIFAHNLFTVQFMWDRLPLYIVAIYPALTQLAYELVRVLGIFKHRGALAGSVAVAFVCQVFYEIFDQLGPQLMWWAWNDANQDVNHPALASVPMNSMVLFASVSFGVMTYLVVRLVGRESRRGWSLTWRILLAGVLAPPAMSLFGIPSSIFGGRHSQRHRPGMGAGDRARTDLARRGLDPAHASTPRRRAGADDTVRQDLPGCLSRGHGRALGDSTPGVPRREGRCHQRRHADRQRSLHDRLLHRRDRRTVRARRWSPRQGRGDERALMLSSACWRR